MEAYTHPDLRRRGKGSEPSKRRKTIFQEDKSKCLVNRCLSGHAKTTGRREEPEDAGPVRPSLCSGGGRWWWLASWTRPSVLEAVTGEVRKKNKKRTKTSSWVSGALLVFSSRWSTCQSKDFGEALFEPLHLCRVRKGGGDWLELWLETSAKNSYLMKWFVFKNIVPICDVRKNGPVKIKMDMIGSKDVWRLSLIFFICCFWDFIAGLFIWRMWNSNPEHFH